MSEPSFSEYQEFTKSLAFYPILGVTYDGGKTWKQIPWGYPALGLGGEIGEILEKLKKAIRDHAAEPSEDYRKTIKKEIGDAQWYLAELARVLEFPLGEVALENMIKLNDRLKRGTLSGEGDHR